MIDRAAIVADLERVRIDFQHLIEMAGDDEWIKPTKQVEQRGAAVSHGVRVHGCTAPALVGALV